MHLAVTGDVEMITDIGKAPCQMTAAKRLHREVTVTARSCNELPGGLLPIVLIETACFHRLTVDAGSQAKHSANVVAGNNHFKDNAPYRF